MQSWIYDRRWEPYTDPRSFLDQLKSTPELNEVEELESDDRIFGGDDILEDILYEDWIRDRLRLSFIFLSSMMAWLTEEMKGL